MSFLPDDVIGHLRAVIDNPELPGGRYRIVRPLGEGGMGVVYLADDAALERSVAIKVLHAAATGDMAMRLAREAKTIAQLEHPSIVPIHEVGSLADGRPYYVMKYVAGKTLAQVVADKASRSVRLRLFLNLCDGVAFAHDRGVVHRDLKPANVMVGPFGELYVMDWGIAKVCSEARALDAKPTGGVTQHGAILGTPAYMAPEQRGLDPAAVDHRADIHALGSILRFVLTGREPSDANDDVGLPRALRSLIAKARAARPPDRYQTVLELSADVTRFLDGERVTAHREHVVELVARLVDRNRFVVYLVAAYVLLRAAMFFFIGH